MRKDYISIIDINEKVTKKVTNKNLKYLEEDLSFSNNSLTVHIVPHSHDDVGWVRTADQYYCLSTVEIRF